MRVFRKLAILVPVVGILYVGGYVFLPYYSIGPGPARDVEPLIRIEGATRYPSDGRFVLTSVVFQQLTGFGVVGAWLDPNRAVVKREQVYPSGEPAEVERARSISQMDQSKLDATYVVLRQLTGYPKDHGDGVLVEAVVGGCAADGELYPGDLIQRIDGERVDTVRAASRVIGTAESGSTLTFDVTVDGEPETVRLVREPCGGAEEPLVGVSLINNFPLHVTISSGAHRWPVGGADLGPGALRPAHAGRPHRRTDGGRHRESSAPTEPCSRSAASGRSSPRRTTPAPTSSSSRRTTSRRLAPPGITA